MSVFSYFKKMAEELVSTVAARNIDQDILIDGTACRWYIDTRKASDGRILYFIIVQASSGDVSCQITLEQIRYSRMLTGIAEKAGRKPIDKSA